MSVKISPVFWIFGSRSLRFCEGSVVVRSIPGSNAISAFIDINSTGEIPHFSSELISIVVSLGSPIDLSLKSVTTNPDLNLLRPFASVTSLVAASNSSKLKDVISSRFSILVSNAAMSRIVNLLLSLRRILEPVLGL